MPSTIHIALYLGLSIGILVGLAVLMDILLAEPHNQNHQIPGSPSGQNGGDSTSSQLLENGGVNVTCSKCGTCNDSLYRFCRTCIEPLPPFRR